MRLAAVLVLSFLITASSAQAQSVHHATQTPEQVAKYWTKERMQSAIPRDVVRGGDAKALARKPGGGGSTTTWRRLAVTLPYGGDDLNNGKVFFTMDGGNYVCSGTSVETTTETLAGLVWTAGHCVTDRGSNATNFMFAPGYVDGTAPYGRWAATGALASTTDWRTKRDFEYDFGAVRVVPAAGAAPRDSLDDVAIPRSMAFGDESELVVGSTQFDAYGYPAAGKFNGHRLYLCDSTLSRRDDSAMGIGCDMTGGSSGGGWLNANSEVASVNSYHYQSIKNVMFGPYQGSVAQALYLSMD